jgi:hypothetical protein
MRHEEVTERWWQAFEILKGMPVKLSVGEAAVRRAESARQKYVYLLNTLILAWSLVGALAGIGFLLWCVKVLLTSHS